MGKRSTAADAGDRRAATVPARLGSPGHPGQPRCLYLTLRPVRTGEQGRPAEHAEHCKIGETQ
jgi:hypothetical protein